MAKKKKLPGVRRSTRSSRTVQPDRTAKYAGLKDAGIKRAPLSAAFNGTNIGSRNPQAPKAARVTQSTQVGTGGRRAVTNRQKTKLRGKGTGR